MKYRIKIIKEKTPDRFTGRYKQHEIHIEREDNDEHSCYGGFYITVTGPDGCYCYDGWWNPYHYASIDEAIQEALIGSQLISNCVKVKIRENNIHFGLKKGEIYEAKPYRLDSEKLTLLKRIPDGYDPECNCYRHEVEVVNDV